MHCSITNWKNVPGDRPRPPRGDERRPVQEKKPINRHTLFEFEFRHLQNVPRLHFDSALLLILGAILDFLKSFIAGNCDFLTCPPLRPKAMWRRSQTAKTICENANMSIFSKNNTEEWGMQCQWQLHSACSKFTTELHMWKVPGGLQQALLGGTQAFCQNHKEMNKSASEDYS